MDPNRTSYSLIPTTELDGNTNIADLWPSNNPSLQAPPGIGYARRYAASKPPYSCKFKRKKKLIIFIKSFYFYF
jgi:hypothetical protein